MYAKDRTTIVDRREMLRVKLKNLAQEAKLIRREEQRSFGQLREELYRHRIDVVRVAARETHLAYGFIRGRAWADMEQNPETFPNWEAVRKMVKKYGPKDFVEPECMKPALKKAA